MYIDITAPKTSSNVQTNISLLNRNPNTRKVYIETYGCQMNIADSELVASLMVTDGFSITDTAENADVILLNTCSIRDNAEKKIFYRLNHLKAIKKKNFKLVVGIIGCMAERLKEKLIGERNLVSIVVGPDEYRNLPHLVNQAFAGEQGIAVKLSKVETYDDIIPLRTEGLTAWVSIMRGCNNFCAFCVVPYTRGRERSRPFMSVVKEAIGLYESGIKEINLLGQNVNSYRDEESNIEFPILLETIAKEIPDIRIRYTTSHPHDMSNDLIEAHSKYSNICNSIHLPVQSGSNKILKKMRRDYSVEHYLERIDTIRKIVPGVSLTTDIISGFCTETEQDHQDTLNLIKEVKYDGAYMYKYSPRENTLAWKYEDDVTEEEKIRRLNEIIETQHAVAHDLNLLEIGREHQILIEGASRKNDEMWVGRTDTNKVCILPYSDKLIIGNLANVKVVRTTSATLYSELID